MEVSINSLQELMRVRKVTNKDLSQLTGISEATIGRHLADCNWDMVQVDKIIRAMNIPTSSMAVLFYEPLVALNATKVTE